MPTHSPARTHQRATRFTVPTLLLLLLVACSDETPSEPGFNSPVNADFVTATNVRDRYIVVLSGATTDAPGLAGQFVREHGGTVHFIYSKVFTGFAATLPPQALEALRRNPQVEAVVPDEEVHIEEVQSSPVWNLDRIDQRALPLSNSYQYDAYGSGVTVYVMDTGIRYTHAEFEGRAVPGFDAFGSTGNDCGGHGTHVAGTIGGKTYGVAKGVRLVSVRVFDCNGFGTTSAIAAGSDWILNHLSLPAVANMSFGSGANSTNDNSASKLLAAGVSVAVAAGNSGADACNYSPARVPGVMTVGNSTSSDTRASTSNYGGCVDWFAPGSTILSAGIRSDTEAVYKSGTSMAAPHTAGVAALFLEIHPAATPQTVADSLYARTTKSVIASSNSSNNHLLYSLSGQLSVPPPPPTAAITLSAVARRVKNDRYVDLLWSGATSSTVDVFRNNAKLTTVANGGAFTDRITTKGGGSWSYRVCEAGKTVCSADRTVTF